MSLCAASETHNIIFWSIKLNLGISSILENDLGNSHETMAGVRSANCNLLESVIGM